MHGNDFRVGLTVVAKGDLKDGKQLMAAKDTRGKVTTVMGSGRFIINFEGRGLVYAREHELEIVQ